MRHSLVSTVIAILFAASAVVCHATTYYVATTGSDTNSGLTTNQPFRTVQKAASLLQAGDTAYLRGGTYREAVVVTNSGNAVNPIILSAYNLETVTISGSALVTNWSLDTNFIWVVTNWVPEPQQVFSCGASLRQIGLLQTIAEANYTIFGTNKGDMFAGSFYYDRASSNLYAWLADNSDPNASFMEASTKTLNWISVCEDDDT